MYRSGWGRRLRAEQECSEVDDDVVNCRVPDKQ